MFSLIYLKFLSLNNRARLIAGISVVFVLTALGLFSLSKLIYFDNLNSYASEYTVFYLHYNYKSAPENLYKLKFTDSLLDYFGLKNLDQHLLGNEQAVICNDWQNDFSCGLIIKVKDNTKTDKFLADNHFFYRKLANKTFIVSDRQDWLASLKFSYNPFNYIKYQSALGKYGQLTIILNKSNNLTNNLAKLIYLSGITTSLKINGSIMPSGIYFRPTGFSQWFSKPNKQKLAKISEDMTNDLKNQFQVLVSASQPRIKTFYLNDGTKISEVFANKDDVQTQIFSKLYINPIHLRISELPKSSIKSILSNFIEINGTDNYYELK